MSDNIKKKFTLVPTKTLSFLDFIDGYHSVAVALVLQKCTGVVLRSPMVCRSRKTVSQGVRDIDLSCPDKRQIIPLSDHSAAMVGAREKSQPIYNTTVKTSILTIEN